MEKLKTNGRLVTLRLDDECEEIIMNLRKQGYTISGFIKAMLKREAEKIKQRL